jgi:hypothetical protein
VNGGLPLDVVVGNGTAILKLLASEQRLHLEGNGLAILREIILLSKRALIRALVTLSLLFLDMMTTLLWSCLDGGVSVSL